MLNRYKYLLSALCLIVILIQNALADGDSKAKSDSTPLKQYSAYAKTTDESARCLNCHAARMPKLIETWEHSSHAKNGVGCYECHKAEKGDLTAKQGHFGFDVQLVVSPARCGSCHQEEYEGFASSKHATSFDTIKFMPMRKDNPELFDTSCTTCHGSVVNMKKGKPVDASWPNKGIGRINPDKSIGNCAACHGAHSDSLEVARDASTCIKCHNTDFSPAAQAWSMSAHGAVFDKYNKNVDFSKTLLKTSDDNILKPNCQTCHIQSPGKNGKNTHNVSSRLSWNLSALKANHTDDWGTKRLEMQKSCRNCHSSSQIDMYYRKLDAAVVSTNHIVDRKIKPDTPFLEQLNLRNSLLTYRISVAMLGSVNPLLIEILSH